jgi:tRNA/tmRNA/rRNA uracil-C5-methylase (TrmA/RlmC/RlmD family)
VPLPQECEVVGLQTAATFGTRTSTPAAASQHSALSTQHSSSTQHSPAVEATAAPQLWEIGGRIIPDDRELTLTVNEFTYRLGTSAFFQVNRHLLGTMLRLVAAHASRVTQRGTAVDLYGGVGFFTLPLAKLFQRVTLIEGSPVSARYARMNVPRNVNVIEAPVEAKMRTFPEVDFTFLDPPRAGTRREVISTIGERTKEIIAYLSCDPVTFARDASRLIASGWRLSTLDLVDLFPNTHHVETLSSFERAQRPS